jgi:hypothetical protein
VVIKKDIKDKGMSLKKFIKRLKFIYRFDDSYIDSLMNELKYEIADEVKSLAVPKIMTEDETLDVLINEKKSICYRRHRSHGMGYYSGVYVSS